MNVKTRKKESGQILVLIAVGFIVLLGFTALAIDGGMVYSDRRQAQNAADAAALAGSLEKARGQTDDAAVAKAEEILVTNGFKPGEAAIVVLEGSDSGGYFAQVEVDLSSTTKMFFAQLFGFNEIENQVEAVSKTRGGTGGPAGAAIIAMGDCTKSQGEGGVDHLLNINGGGHSGGIIAYYGDIFLNSPDPDTNHCAIDPPDSAHNWGIRACGGNKIYSVGDHDYTEEGTNNGNPGGPYGGGNGNVAPECEDSTDNVYPTPIETVANNGFSIGDPLSFLEEPMCTSDGDLVEAGKKKDNTPDIYSPGSYGPGHKKSFPDKGNILLQPGIYCVSGDIKLSGQDLLMGDGVVLFLEDSGFDLTGNAALGLTAPTEENCLGTEGSNTASCTYKGLVFFMKRGLHNAINTFGNGNVKIVGTVYALDGDVGAMGGGYDPDDWVVMGQIIARSLDGRGNGSFVVYFNDDVIYHGIPSISLTK